MRKPSIYLLTSVTLGIGLVHAEESVDFMTQVKPLIEGTCIHCHGPKEQEGDYRMDTKAAAFAGGDSWPDETIVPGDSNASAAYWMTTEPSDSPDVMPPKKVLTHEQQEILRIWVETGAEWPEGVVLEEQPRMDFKVNVMPLLTKGGPFSEKQMLQLRLWVEQGAVWPENFSLGDKKEEGGLGDNIELVGKIRENIWPLPRRSRKAR